MNIRMIAKDRFALGIALAALTATYVQAGLSFDLGTSFSGTAPSGAPPWLSISFVTSGSDVIVTFTNTLHASTEFATEWNFNLDPSLDPTLLSFTYDSGQVVAGTATSKSNQKADGDGYYDVEFDFPNSGDRFVGGETSTYKISYGGSGTFNENSFNFYSSSKKGEDDGLGFAHSMAHIQGINGGGASDWIGDPVTIPTPGAALLGLIGLASVGTIRRRVT